MNKINELVGKTVKKIFFDENGLKFETDNGDYCFEVMGDCCSHSLFYDFYGVKNLLSGNPITNVEEIPIEPKDVKTVKGEYDGEYEKDKNGEHECIKLYGYRLTTISKEFGEVSSVFSFRNYSNGYYGGWMESCDSCSAPEITDDVI